MRYSPAFTFSSSYLRGVWLRAGLRLLGARQFQAFLVASAYLSRGSSYYFGSSYCFRTVLTSAWLTQRSSRPAYGGRLSLFVRSSNDLE